MSGEVQHHGGVRRFTIADGAWTRGGQRRDLIVTVTYVDGDRIDRVSISHRSLTPAAATALAELATGQDSEWAKPGDDS